MSDDDEVFTQSQWEAARLLVARLRSEADADDFDSEALGITWPTVQDIVVAKVDRGVDITSGDLLHASLALLWSAVSQLADAHDVDELAVVQGMALTLASFEPAST